MKTTTTCEAILARLTLYLLGDLDAQTQTLIAGHLEQCEACRAYADKLAPTLDVLRTALQDVPNAPLALSDEHRKRIKAAYRQRMTAQKPVKKRKPLLLRFHILEMAAALIAGLMIISVMFANFGGPSPVRSMMVSVVEPEMMMQPSAMADFEPIEELDEIAELAPMEGRELSVNGGFVTHRSGGKLAREDALPPGTSVTLDRLVESERPRAPMAKGRAQARLSNAMADSGERMARSSEESRVGWANDQKQDSGVVVGGAFMDQNLNGVATVSGAEGVSYNFFSEAPEPPAPTEVQMDISADMPSLPTAVSAPAPAAVTSVDVAGYFALPPSATPPARPAPKSQHRFRQVPAPELSDELNVPVDALESSKPAPPSATASVQPAEFDSVAIVKSPVVLYGSEGGRSSGARGEARREAFSDDRDIPIEIVDKGWGTDSRQRENAQVASGPEPKPEEPSKMPILGDIPVTGRLKAIDRALSDGEGREREGAKRLEKKSRKDRDGDADFIAIEGADRVRSEEELDGLRIQAEELRKIVVDLNGHSSDMGVDSTSVAPQAGDFVMLAEGKDASPEVKREELRRVVQDLRGQIADMRGQISFLKAPGSAAASESGNFVILAGGDAASVLPGKDSGAFASSDNEELPDAFAPRFAAAGVNPFVAAAVQAFSTFSIDVDTASYTVSRNYMLGGHLPPPEAVRTEEFVNFFDYAYDPPVGNTFRVAAEIAPSRFGRGLHLLKLGVKGRRLGREEQRQASLTLLIDSSGSMNQPDRLGLVRSALELLLDELAETDQVAIIQFDNRARLVLAHTPVAQRETIRRALGAIQCGGGTNLEAGLGQAYEQAAKAFISRGENRILLMSDGVVNLGETAADGIVKRIEANRRQGLYLSVFGFGMGIYDDAMLKELASKGNGAYAFIDSEAEARRVFVDDLSATLNTIAEDVKIQIEFNPKRVNQYRQLGYEQRQLTKEQFRDDTVDAGEVGSGQSVTAIYELSLTELPVAYPRQMPAREANDDWLAIARVRYRRVDNGRIEEIEQRIYERDIRRAFDAASPRFRLAAGVAAFAEILRGSPFVQGVAFDDVAAVLRPVALERHLDARIRELVQMVETAGGLAR